MAGSVLGYQQKVFLYHLSLLGILDYYLTIPAKNFSSPLPFTIVAAAEIPADALDDIIPNRIYTKKELLIYLQSSRKKCHQIISRLTPEKLEERWIQDKEWGNKNYAVLELLLYNMRHVQHHAAQLNLLLRQKINDAPKWVSRAADGL